MQVQPYLFFDGRCEEALEFYKKVLGAEVGMMMRFKDAPKAEQGPEMSAHGGGDKIMHAAFRVGETTLMASDGNCQGQPKFQGVSLSLSAPTAAEAKRLWEALGDGGKTEMPFSKTFFSPGFGMVADRFGVSWMVIAMDPAHQAAA